MTEEDKRALASAVADHLPDRDLTARRIVDRIEHDLYQRGWMPPATYDRITDWAGRTAQLPEHHINRDVLTSHLSELAAILHDRA